MILRSEKQSKRKLKSKKSSKRRRKKLKRKNQNWTNFLQKVIKLKRRRKQCISLNSIWTRFELIILMSTQKSAIFWIDIKLLIKRIRIFKTNSLLFKKSLKRRMKKSRNIRSKQVNESSNLIMRFKSNKISWQKLMQERINFKLNHKKIQRNEWIKCLKSVKF